MNILSGLSSHKHYAFLPLLKLGIHFPPSFLEPKCLQQGMLIHAQWVLRGSLSQSLSSTA